MVAGLVDALLVTTDGMYLSMVANLVDALLADGIMVASLVDALLGTTDGMHLSMAAGLVDALPGTIDGMYRRYPLGLEMQPPSQVRSASVKSHTAVEYWNTPRAQMNTSRALNQPHHEPLAKHPVETHVVHSQ
jgi:hypothetical protein